MPIYQAPNNRKVPLNGSEHFNDQIILSGVDQAFLVNNGVFFIEHFEAATGTTIIIEDGQGNTIASGVTSFTQDHSPIRCDYGVSITGNLAMLKGFIMRNVFA